MIRSRRERDERDRRNRFPLDAGRICDKLLFVPFGQKDYGLQGIIVGYTEKTGDFSPVFFWCRHNNCNLVSYFFCNLSVEFPKGFKFIFYQPHFQPNFSERLFKTTSVAKDTYIPTLLPH
jgi:hypothetical protein